MSQADTFDIHPTTAAEWNPLMVSQMARSIEIANRENPNSWCVPTWQGIPVAAVGQITILSLGPAASYGFFISTEDYHGPDLESLPGVTVTTRSYTTTSWGAYLRLDDDHLAENLSILRAAHEAGIHRLAMDANGRAQRWKEHQSAFVERAREISGLSIPDPGYINEIPVTATQQTGLQANELLPNSNVKDVTDPTPEAARQMARTIIAAHAISPTCWAVFPTNKRIAVMVGNVTVGGSAVSGKYDFVVDRTLISDETEAYLDTIQVSKIPKGYEALSFPRLPDLTVDEQFDAFAAAHESALSIVTDPYKRAVLWQNHDDALRKRIEDLSDVVLPLPGYLGALPQRPETLKPLELISRANPMGDPGQNIRESFAASGLHYTESQIAAFYTALQTKGFVVLSGISGTGKSKIATGFVDMLPAPRSEGVWSLPIDDGRITIQVKPYMLKHRNVTFPSKYLDRFPGYSSQNSRTVDVRISNTIGTGNLRYELRNGAPSVTLWFHKSLYAAIESQQLDAILVVDLSYSDDQFVSAVSFIPIEEAGDISHLDLDQSNHLFLAVRPDWRDSTSLLGYYNPLTQTYEWTDFLKFIIQAGENYRGAPEDRIAWFVILDEMNLAHVEYYFADLLSVIESGRDAEGWTTEPLRLTYPDALEMNDEAPPRELFLPPNLYIIGTVNMDETTHAFSPKVLDRAFTIELTDVDFRDYPTSGVASDSEGLDDATKAAMLTAFSRDGAFARIDKAEIGEFIERNPVVRDRLQALNDVLRPFRMHFGYRVFDEVTQYLANNQQNGMATFEEAFDQAVFMKVLPKFSGSRARLQSPLHGVLAWAVDPARTSREDISNAVEGLMLYESGKAASAWEGDAAFPRVAERVRDMLVALERDGFVSFG